MARLEEDDFTLAKRILTNFDEITDPAKRIQTFETGIDLLDQYVREHKPLEEDTEREIKELRFTCLKNLLGSFTEVRGGSIKPWMEHVRILLGKMKPELNAVRQGYSQ